MYGATTASLYSNLAIFPTTNATIFLAAPLHLPAALVTAVTLYCYDTSPNEPLAYVAGTGPDGVFCNVLQPKRLIILDEDGTLALATPGRSSLRVQPGRSR